MNLLVCVGLFGSLCVCLFVRLAVFVIVATVEPWSGCFFDKHKSSHLQSAIYARRKKPLCAIYAQTEISYSHRCNVNNHKAKLTKRCPVVDKHIVKAITCQSDAGKPTEFVVE